MPSKIFLKERRLTNFQQKQTLHVFQLEKFDLEKTSLKLS